MCSGTTRTLLILVALTCPPALHPQSVIASPIVVATTARIQSTQSTYFPADLTITNDTDSIIQSVLIHSRHGGPYFLFPVTIAPHSTQSLSVNLPALASPSELDLTLLSGHSPQSGVIETLETYVPFSPQQVEASRALLLDSEPYRKWESHLPHWPGELKRNIFLCLVLSVLACGATLLIRRQAVRLLALAVVIIGTTAASYAIMRGCPLVENINAANQIDPSVEIVLGARRTTRWMLPRTDVYPVYRNERQMLADEAVIIGGKGVSLTFEPSQLRVFRPIGR